MANHASALKRARQSEKRRMRNKAVKTQVKTAAHAVQSAVEEKSLEAARASLAKAASVIHHAAAKKVIHKNKAARRISRLARRVNKLAVSA